MFLLAALCCLSLSQQFSAPQAKTEFIASTIGNLPNSVGVVPGKTFQVAVHMKMAPGWHSYYLNPGESGMATKIEWRLPPGFTAGPIRWPVPTRIVVGGVAGNVYENDAWLVTDITPPKSWWPTQRLEVIVAKVSWLLCREACVPQKSSLSITIDETKIGLPNPAFAPALRNLPAAGEVVKCKAWVEGKTAVLSLDGHRSGKGAVKFFPSDATYFGADLPKIDTTDSGIKLEIPLSKYAPSLPKRLSGILVLPQTGDGGSGAHWIDVQVTKR